MKKIIIILALLLSTYNVVFAQSTPKDALAFYKDYINAANTYSPTVITYFSPSARIIRQVLKKDGTIVTRETNTARYISEMKKGQVIARLRKYKNYYTNLQVKQVGNDTYKITSYRQPSGESYKLKNYVVVKKQPNGRWYIIEEMMQSKVQLLINAQ